MKTNLLALVLGLFASTALGAEGMDRIIYRHVPAEEVDRSKAPFASHPHTLYRFGPSKGRTEHRDPETGIELLLVYAGPDLWMANLADNRGLHIIDGGPTFFFHAPIAPMLKGQHPKGHPLGELEFGNEMTFLREHHASVKGQSQFLVIYTVQMQGLTVELELKRADRKPSRIRILSQGKIDLNVEYLDYSLDLPPDEKLFTKPAGIEFKEASPPGAGGKDPAKPASGER